MMSLWHKYKTGIILIIFLGIVFILYIYFGASKLPPNKPCLDPQTQKRIIDEIEEKLKQIDACDCKQYCKEYNWKYL